MTRTGRRQLCRLEVKEIMKEIISHKDVRVVSRKLAERICRLYHVRGCSVLLFDDRTRRLFRVGTHGISGEYLRKGPLFVDKRCTAFATGRPVFVKDLRRDPRIQYPEAAQREGLVSMLSVPIRYRESSIGMIRLYQGDPWEPDDDTLDLFGMIGEHLAVVIEHNGLRESLSELKAEDETLPFGLVAQMFGMYG